MRPPRGGGLNPPVSHFGTSGVSGAASSVSLPSGRSVALAMDPAGRGGEGVIAVSQFLALKALLAVKARVIRSTPARPSKATPPAR